ncbi:MAG: hypothetical protein LUD39_06280 [Opitutae bacterium]|nr:hypothetical protein [Opitutae bacterium]MCD8299342.1 hypothetical protein [Opitutae bacterium]
MLYFLIDKIKSSSNISTTIRVIIVHLLSSARGSCCSCGRICILYLPDVSTDQERPAKKRTSTNKNSKRKRRQRYINGMRKNIFAILKFYPLFD